MASHDEKGNVCQPTGIPSDTYKDEVEIESE